MANAESLMMAAETSYPAMARPVAVVSPSFCLPHVLDLAIVRKLIAVTDGNFLVTDTNGAVIFKVRGAHFSLHDRRVLIDAAGNPVVTLRQKTLTAHRRWQVFRGDSSNSDDLVFSVRKSSLILFKTELDVFLAANTNEDVPDFKLEGSWLERSCTIYSGDKSVVIAQMHKKHTVQSLVLGKDKFGVTVYPNVDYAFITALVVILDEINEDKDD